MGPLALLQIGAWAWMMTSYSQQSSIEQAFRETFGGDRPCEVCRLIDMAEQPNSEAPFNTPNKNDCKNLKLILGLVREVTIPVPRSSTRDYVSDVYRCEEVGHSVPKPPPRTTV